MKYLATLLLPALLLPAACHSSGDVRGEDEATDRPPAAAFSGGEMASLEITLEQQDARQLAARMHVFQEGMQARIEAPDSRTWVVSGPASEVRLMRLMALACDGPQLTPEHVGRVYDIEHRDSRLLVNSARGREDWGASWIVVGTTEPRWYVMVPRGELGAFEAVLAQLDQPH